MDLLVLKRRRAIVGAGASRGGIQPMVCLISKFAKDESGATAIEYGLIAALVAVAAIVGMTALGTSLNTIFGDVSDTLNSAT
jgi:pilus assembly protein Flp/PilA